MNAASLKAHVSKAGSFFLKSRLVSFLLLACVLIAVTLFVHRSFSGFTRSDFSSISIRSLVTPLALICLAYLNRFAFWVVLTSSFELRASVFLTSRAFFYSLLGRYIPGNAGLFLFRIRAYKAGSQKKVGAALITEYISTILAACVLVIAGTLFIPVSNPLLTKLIPGSMLVLLLVLLHPPVLKRTINSLLKLMGKEQLDVFPAIRIVLAVTAGYILTGMLHGLAMFLLLRMLTPMGLASYPIVTGAYYMAGLVGMFAFFAPGGIGVREGVLFLLLPFVAGAQPVVLAAALMRVLTLCSELLLFASSSVLYLLYERRRICNEK